MNSIEEIILTDDEMEEHIDHNMSQDDITVVFECNLAPRVQQHNMPSNSVATDSKQYSDDIIPVITLSDSEDNFCEQVPTVFLDVSPETLDKEEEIIKELGVKKFSELEPNSRKLLEARIRREKSEVILGRVVINYPHYEKIWHECSSSCLIDNSDPMNGSFSDVSPLLIPISTGWKREISIMEHTRLQTVQKYVLYTSPCGKSFYDHKAISAYLKKTNCNLSLSNFCFDQIVDPSKLVKIPDNQIMHSDISHGKELFPVTAINTVDITEIPNIQYITTRQFSPNLQEVMVRSSAMCSGCSCEDDCQNSSKCECQLLTVDSITQFSKRKTSLNGYTNRFLKQKIITGIYECNQNCKCNTKRCPNRVAQFPISYPLSLFRTGLKGWGVRTLVDIPQGAFVMNFLGQLYSQDTIDEVPKFIYTADIDYIDTIEMQKKMAQELFDRRRRSKHFSLPCNGIDWSSCFDHNEHLFTIDASTMGNLARYMNHSCTPNVFSQFVFVDTHDMRLPWVSFFTNTKINAGEELTWDYDYKVNSQNVQSSYCYCGSTQCTEQGVLRF